MCLWSFDDFFSQQIFYSIAVASGMQVFHISLINNFSSQTSGFRADIYNIVGSTDDFFIMLYHYHCIAQLLQLAEYFDKLVCISAVKSDTRFVQNIK